jgi:hypothetical protein
MAKLNKWSCRSKHKRKDKSTRCHAFSVPKFYIQIYAKTWRANSKRLTRNLLTDLSKEDQIDTHRTQRNSALYDFW